MPTEGHNETETEDGLDALTAWKHNWVLSAPIGTLFVYGGTDASLDRVTRRLSWVPWMQVGLIEKGWWASGAPSRRIEFVVKAGRQERALLVARLCLFFGSGHNGLEL